MGTVPIFLAAVASHAHGLHQREGTARVERDRVVTVVEAETGREQALLDELAIRDADGRRLTGRVVSSVAGGDHHATVTLEHALPQAERWLSFQLVAPEASAARARRLVLDVDDGSTHRVIDLTSGGNVETLRFPEGAMPQGCGPQLLDAHPDRMQSVMGLLRRDGGEARLDVVMPLGIFESFVPLARADRDVIAPSEQDASRAAVLELVRSRVAPRARGGEVAFLGLDDPATGPAPEPRPLGAWTARVRVSMVLPPDAPAEWDLYNALVSTARLVVLDGASCTERRLSSYDREKGTGSFYFAPVANDEPRPGVAK